MKFPSDKTKKLRRVCLESPYRGEVNRNLAYARAAMLDSISRGEAPFASHLLYTSVLEDCIEDQRELGIAAGLIWAEAAEATVVYIDFGITEGMKRGIEAAEKAGRPVEYRTIA